MRSGSNALGIAVTLLLMAGMLFAETVKITKGPVVEHVGANNAEIAWSTNTASPTIVRYGTDPNNLTQRAEMPWGALTHRVTLKNLEPGKTYYFHAESGSDQDDKQANSGVGKFSTPGQAADNNRDGRQDNDERRQGARAELKITNGPTLEHVGETDATVAWSTSLPSSSIVKYGTDPHNLRETAEEPWGATTHRVQLKNLRPNTRYYYSVHSAQGKDAPGQADDTPPQEFTTGSGGREARR